VVVTDGAFVAAVGGFLVMHYQLLAANCTTIEMYEKDRIHPWPYNKGFKRNFEEVFGRRWAPGHSHCHGHCHCLDAGAARGA
jgi:palmitoyltransferase